jgi:hypothetical protein
MLNKQSAEDQPDLISDSMTRSYSRRKFFGIMGAGSAVLLAASCKKDNPGHGKNSNGGIDLGSGDIGILNYAYALEQLEAAFYMKVISSPFSGMSMMEKSYLTDIRDHEIAHREFFKAALAAKAIPGLEVDFSSIDFSNRTSVLRTAKAFEDLGVSAYNGAGKLISNPDYLTLAGKIVSVEARHAAWIRDLITPGTFADMSAVDSNGLDMAKMPDDVLAVAATYLKSKLDASNLPTN